MIGFRFNVCPHKIKSDTNHPLTTKKQEGGGGGFVHSGSIFLPSLSGVYGWVSSTIFGGGQAVK